MAKKVKLGTSAAPLTILVVEDNLASLDYLATLLSYRNYAVLTATNAADRFATAQSRRPDLIITDVVMPDCDGYEFVRKLRAHPSLASIPIIFWTAVYSDRGNAILLAETLGVECVLAKPSEPEAMLDAVRRAVTHPAPSPSPLPAGAVEDEHKRLLTNMVFEQVSRLQTANDRLRISEAHYRALFEDNPVPMWIVDQKGRRFLKVNRAAELHYGYSKRQFKAMPVARLNADSLPGRDSEWESDGAGMTAAASSLTEVRHRKKNGEVREVSLTRRAIVLNEQAAWLEVAVDITAQKFAEKQLSESAQQMHFLAAQLRVAQEEERTRISRLMHDEFGQRLVALKMNAERVVDARAEDPLVRDKLEASLVMMDELTALVQRVATDLRPAILDYGIGGAVEALVRSFASSSGIQCRVRVPAEEPELTSEKAAEIYRILQECLTNAARHAGASSLYVELKQTGPKLVLTVRDDGRGITPEEKKDRRALGLLGMKERAAQIGAALSIKGRAGFGTTVKLQVLLRSDPPELPVSTMIQ